MKSIQALREQRAAVALNIKKLMDDNETTWEATHQETYDASMAEVDDIDGQIKRIEQFNALAVEKAVHGDNADLVDKHTKDKSKHKVDSDAMKAYLMGGINNLDENALNRQRARQTPDIRAAMSTGVGAEGGFTVAEEFYRQLTQALKAYGGLRKVATIMQTGTGATMNFPATDATAEIGEIVGENAAVAELETAFSNIVIDVYKYSSKKIALPFELLQDSMFDMEAYMRELLAMRIGRITEAHFTTGTGTAQPRGVITAAGAGKIGTTGQTATVIYDDLVDLIHSVDPLYRANARFMMHDQSTRNIRKILDANGRPIFVPGYETNVPGGAPDTLLGVPIVVNQEMAVMAADAKSIAFGDFSKYVIREVMDLTLFRMADSAFILNGQIGFVAFNRQGGNLIDVGGAVKYYQNSTT